LATGETGVGEAACPNAHSGAIAKIVAPDKILQLTVRDVNLIEYSPRATPAGGERG
jgi:hypothetical protein